MPRIEVTGEIVEWRGPAPFHFLAVPEAGSQTLRGVSAEVTYGWGMIPVTAQIGDVEWTTSLWPKEGRYLLPLKDAVRKRAGVALGDVVTVTMWTGDREESADRDHLIAVVRRVLDGEAETEEQEEAWLSEFARRVPHPRAIDLVLFGEVELGEDVSAERIVDAALSYVPWR